MAFKSLKRLFLATLLASSSFGFEIKQGQQDVMAGLKLQIFAQKDGAITTKDHSSTNFSVQNARIYLMGRLNKIVEFGANFDFSDNNLIPPDGTARAHTGMHKSVVKDAYINLRFSRAFNIMTGLFMDPYSRISLTDSYYTIIPTMEGIGTINSAIMDGYLKGPMFVNPFTPLDIGSDIQNGYRDMGIVLWGSKFHSAIKYYVDIANGRYDYELSQNNITSPSLKYGFRIELSPTFLGFSNNEGYMDEDTYFGHKNILALGIAYEQDKFTNQSGSTNSKSFDTDLLFEKKFKSIVPNLQIGYSNTTGLPYGMKLTNYTVKAPIKATGYYLQTALLYDKYVGIGKPSLAFRYETDENTNNYQNKAKINRLSIFAIYYINSESAKISLGADFINPDSNLVYDTANGQTTLKNYWDYTLALQTMF